RASKPRKPPPGVSAMRLTSDTSSPLRTTTPFQSRPRRARGRLRRNRRARGGEFAYRGVSSLFTLWVHFFPCLFVARCRGAMAYIGDIVDRLDDIGFSLF